MTVRYHPPWFMGLLTFRISFAITSNTPRPYIYPHPKRESSSPHQLHQLRTSSLPTLSTLLALQNSTTPQLPVMAANALQQQTQSQPTGIDLYSRFALAGAFSCGVTHGVVTPFGTSICSSGVLAALFPLAVLLLTHDLCIRSLQMWSRPASSSTQRPTTR